MLPKNTKIIIYRSYATAFYVNKNFISSPFWGAYCFVTRNKHKIDDISRTEPFLKNSLRRVFFHSKGGQNCYQIFGWNCSNYQKRAFPNYLFPSSKESRLLVHINMFCPDPRTLFSGTSQKLPACGYWRQVASPTETTSVSSSRL